MIIAGAVSLCLLCAVVAFALYSLRLVEQESYNAHNDSNMLIFEGIDRLTWTQENYSITDNQTFTGASAIGVAIDVVAECRGSVKPAQAFFHGILAENMIA